MLDHATHRTVCNLSAMCQLVSRETYYEGGFPIYPAGTDAIMRTAPRIAEIYTELCYSLGLAEPSIYPGDLSGITLPPRTPELVSLESEISEAWETERAAGTRLRELIDVYRSTGGDATRPYGPGFEIIEAHTEVETAVAQHRKLKAQYDAAATAWRAQFGAMLAAEVLAMRPEIVAARTRLREWLAVLDGPDGRLASMEAERYACELYLALGRVSHA